MPLTGTVPSSNLAPFCFCLSTLPHPASFSMAKWIVQVTQSSSSIVRKPDDDSSDRCACARLWHTTHPENIIKVHSHSRLMEMLYVFSLCLVVELSCLSYLQHSSGTPHRARHAHPRWDLAVSSSTSSSLRYCFVHSLHQ